MSESNFKFEAGVDYYKDNGRMVLTEHYLTKIRKYCCSNMCRHCPFTPKYQKGATKIENKKDTDDTF